MSEKNALKAIRRDRIGDDYLQAIEQIPGEDDIFRFGMDVQRDLLRGVRSVVAEDGKFGRFGRLVSGGDSFKAEIDISKEGIGNFSQRCLDLFEDQSYKKNFSWIDNVVPVRDKHLEDLLDSKLARAVSLGVKALVLCVPDLLAWDAFDIISFEPKRKNAPVSMLLDVGHWREFMRLSGKVIDGDAINKCRVYCYLQGDPGLKKKWTIRECLHGTIKHKGELYLTHGAHWFKLAKEFVEKINQEIVSIPRSGVTLPPAGINVKEGDYNKSVVQGSNGAMQLLDKDVVWYGGGQSRFEICDLLTLNGELICVKPWGGKAASLSHLFQQAIASADLIAKSPDFVAKASQKISAPFSSAWSSVCDRAVETEIVLAILRGPPKENLPFLAKLGLLHAVNTLIGLRFRPTYLEVPPF